jgi:hypothetical protein
VEEEDSVVVDEEALADSEEVITREVHTAEDIVVVDEEDMLRTKRLEAPPLYCRLISSSRVRLPGTRDSYYRREREMRKVM